ncbi:MAG: stage II sporulation protein M [Anaerolineae bacterium]|nr:stage II sporulation protein M [Anaerolineae bacterium]
MAMLAPSIEQTGAGPRRWLHVLLWNFSRVLMITRREVVDMFRDWRIVVPTLILTVLFPYIANWGAGRMLSWLNQYDAQLIGERLIPFLLMVVGFFPSSFSLIIALESFVGEKERRSLEPLLATPLTDAQLYMGKMLSSTIPPLSGSLVGIAVYLFGVNRSINWSPPPVLLIQILLLTALQALVMVAGAVVVSSQSTSVRAANLLASFIIIPMSFLIQAEAFIMFLANYYVLWWFIIGLAVVLALLVRMGVHTFSREELLGRELDEFNLLETAKSWVKLTLARRPKEQRRTVWRWYRDEVLGVIWRFRLEMLVLMIALGAAYYIGMQYADVFRIPPELFHLQNFEQRFQDSMEQLGLSGSKGILLIVGQNVRVMAVASLLAVFSFGVLMVIILMVPIALSSFLVTQMLGAGIDPLGTFATLIPHIVLEIPAVVVAGAAALRLGAIVISPPPDKTLGQSWLGALADATRVWLAFVLPILLLAAIVEINVTPRIVGWFLGPG